VALVWSIVAVRAMSLANWKSNPKQNIRRAMSLAGYFGSALPLLTSVMSGSRFGRRPE